LPVPELEPAKKRIAAGIAVVALLALIPVGRWERNRHADAEVAGIERVLATIGPIDQPSLDAYRKAVGNPGLDCLLYKRGANPFALEFCIDLKGRVIEAYDRRGSSPRIWSLREDFSQSTVHVDRARVVALIERLERPA
jgi:hypothetical protein